MPVYMVKILWFQGYLALKILQRLKYFQSINFKVQLIFLTVGGARDKLKSLEDYFSSSYDFCRKKVVLGIKANFNAFKFKDIQCYLSGDYS